ncbi:hypothetical protein ACSBR1_018465 [Camellia fascicularis]
MKNVELEVVNNNNKATKKVDLFGGDSGFGKRDAKGFSGGGEEEEVKGKDGLRFRDLGGMEGVVEELKMEVIVPLYHPQLPRWLGVRPMAGILLHGPPGCGKTKLAHAIANETGVPFYKISATELVSGISGASEENIRELFAKACRTAPSIVFIDEIDAIASKRENLRREMERRIVTQLMTCMDESHRLVQPIDVDPNVESSNSRLGYVLMKMLSVLTRNLRLEGAFDLLKIARSTPGFVGADLAALANKAGNLAIKRIIDRRKSEQSREPIDEDHIEDWWRLPWLPEEMENLSITMADFEEAAKLVQPSSRREGFSAIPNVDALTTKRGKEGGWVVERLLNQLLVELDGAEQRQGVNVIGATNRFGKLLYVPLPSPDERGLILKALARKKPIGASVDLIAIGRDEACENLSGADLSALMNEAAMAALEEKLIARSCSSDATSLTIKKMHFEQALEKISPSVSSKEITQNETEAYIKVFSWFMVLVNSPGAFGKQYIIRNGGWRWATAQTSQVARGLPKLAGGHKVIRGSLEGGLRAAKGWQRWVVAGSGEGGGGE